MMINIDVKPENLFVANNSKKFAESKSNDNGSQQNEFSTFA